MPEWTFDTRMRIIFSVHVGWWPPGAENRGPPIDFSTMRYKNFTPLGASSHATGGRGARVKKKEESVPNLCHLTGSRTNAVDLLPCTLRARLLNWYMSKYSPADQLPRSCRWSTRSQVRAVVCVRANFFDRLHFPRSARSQSLLRVHAPSPPSDRR
jgi:hypothetical protein